MVERVSVGAGEIQVSVLVVVDVADRDSDEVARLREAASARSLELPSLIAEEEGRSGADEEKIGIAVRVEIPKGESRAEAGKDALAKKRESVLRRGH